MAGVGWWSESARNSAVEDTRPPLGPAEGERFPPSSRLTGSQEIRRLLRHGQRKKTSHLDVFFLSSGSGEPRFGLVVPRFKRTAVMRNRLKRRLREVGRREVLPRLRVCGAPVDLLVRTRPETYRATYGQLKAELAAVAEEICSRLRSSP